MNGADLRIGIAGITGRMGKLLAEAVPLAGATLAGGIGRDGDLAALAREIADTQALLTDLSGRPPTCFRAPAGFRNPWLAPLLAERALHCAAWSHRAFDTLDPATARIERRLSRGLTPGAVILLHDGRNARDSAGRPVLETVLPKLLQGLQTRGLRAVDLPTLLAGHDRARRPQDTAGRAATPVPRAFR